MNSPIAYWPVEPAIQPQLRAEWAIKKPDGEWWQSPQDQEIDPASTDPTVFRTRVDAEIVTAELLRVATRIGAVNYVPLVMVRDVRITNNGVAVGKWRLPAQMKGVSR